MKKSHALTDKQKTEQKTLDTHTKYKLRDSEVQEQAELIDSIRNQDCYPGWGGTGVGGGGLLGPGRDLFLEHRAEFLTRGNKSVLWYLRCAFLPNNEHLK